VRRERLTQNTRKKKVAMTPRRRNSHPMLTVEVDPAWFTTTTVGDGLAFLPPFCFCSCPGGVAGR
jgi:hypothetical protein